jgi:hypothetical protein
MKYRIIKRCNLYFIQRHQFYRLLHLEELYDWFTITWDDDTLKLIRVKHNYNPTYGFTTIEEAEKTLLRWAEMSKSTQIVREYEL